jgi:hypothetical protein
MEYLIIQDDIINFNLTSQKGRIATAKNAYYQGDIIFENIPYTWLLHRSLWEDYCMICFSKSQKNTEKTLLRCARCKLFFYCSKDCQVYDWESHHKYECKILSNLDCNMKQSSQLHDIIFIARTARKMKMDAQNQNIKSTGLRNPNREDNNTNPTAAQSATDNSQCQFTIKRKNEKLIPIIKCAHSHVQSLTLNGNGIINEDHIRIIQAVCQLFQLDMETVSQLLIKFKNNNFGIMTELLTCIGNEYSSNHRIIVHIPMTYPHIIHISAYRNVYDNITTIS